jgi:hypothetical protein
MSGVGFVYGGIEPETKVKLKIALVVVVIFIIICSITALGLGLPFALHGENVQNMQRQMRSTAGWDHSSRAFGVPITKTYL